MSNARAVPAGAAKTFGSSLSGRLNWRLLGKSRPLHRCGKSVDLTTEPDCVNAYRIRDFGARVKPEPLIFIGLQGDAGQKNSPPTRSATAARHSVGSKNPSSLNAFSEHCRERTEFLGNECRPTLPGAFTKTCHGESSASSRRIASCVIRRKSHQLPCPRLPRAAGSGAKSFSGATSVCLPTGQRASDLS